MKTKRLKIVAVVGCLAILFAILAVLLTACDDVAYADDGTSKDFATKASEWWSANQGTVVGWASVAVSGTISVIFAVFKKKISGSLGTNSTQIESLISKYETSLNKSDSVLKELQNIVTALKEKDTAEALSAIKAKVEEAVAKSQTKVEAVVEKAEEKAVEEVAEKTQEVYIR